MTEAIERYQEIEAQINFQRSLIGETDDERFSKYLRILEDIRNGDNSQENPVDREIARILSLAINEDVDPWNIDLVEFSKMYMKEIERSDDVDFIVAGKIIFLAWSVLKKQSDLTLSKADGVGNEDFFFDGWSPWDFEPYENIDDISYTGRILESEEPPLKKAVRYRSRRKITLIELVDAFEEVRKEVEFREKINKIRKKSIKNGIKAPDVEHKEDLEEEINEVWRRICEEKVEKISITALSNGTKDDFIKVFVAVLFLAHRNRIRIWQESPESEIYVENIMPRDESGKVMEPPIISEKPIKNVLEPLTLSV